MKTASIASLPFCSVTYQFWWHSSISSSLDHFRPGAMPNVNLVKFVEESLDVGVAWLMRHLAQVRTMVSVLVMSEGQHHMMVGGPKYDSQN